MVSENISLARRAEAFTWLISFGARRPINAVRAHFSSWLRNRRVHSGRGVTPADRAALSATNPELLALRQRYAVLQDLIGTSTVWLPGFVTEEDLLYFPGDN